MKKKLIVIITFVAAAIFFTLNCSLPPYSQTKLMIKCKEIINDSGNDHNLSKWFVSDKRVSIDSLVKISSPNISQYDNIRMTIFNALTEIKDTSVLQLMSVKVASGNPIEKLIASAYIYQYYGIEVKSGQNIPLASMLVLFNTTADKLKNRNSTLYKNNEHKIEVAKTFPESESLYSEFIKKADLEYPARLWFIESLLKTEDSEIAAAFLMDLKIELNEKDAVFNAVEETIDKLLNQSISGDWTSY